MVVHTNKWWPLSANSERLRKTAVRLMCKWFMTCFFSFLLFLFSFEKKKTRTFLLGWVAMGAYTRYVTMMPRLRQALVEFENIEDAIVCVQTSQVPVS